MIKKWECQGASFQQRTSSPYVQLSGETLCLLDAKNVPGSTNAKNLHVGKGMEEKPIKHY